jgi:biopolymer transport protein ExbD
MCKASTKTGPLEVTMYNIHAKQVQQYAQKSASNMADVALMTVLSIRQPWMLVGKQLQDVRTNKALAKSLWGGKKNTYLYLQANKHFMYGQMMAIINSNKTEASKAISLMKLFLKVDGLGIAKAGFMCQLTAGLVGCMDSHNIKMYNLNAKDFEISKNPKTLKGIETNLKKIRNYIQICNEYGTDNLWNSWCSLIATKSTKWRDANHVSEVHYTYLTGEEVK